MDDGDGDVWKKEYREREEEAFYLQVFSNDFWTECGKLTIRDSVAITSNQWPP